MENIDIDIEKEISENIDIDKILNRLEFGISNRATQSMVELFSKSKISSSGKIGAFKIKVRGGNGLRVSVRREEKTFCIASF